MSKLRGRRGVVVLGAVIAALALTILIALAVSANKSGRVEAWRGRRFGFGLGIASLVIGGLMIARSRPGQGHYWATVGILTIAALYIGANSYRPKAPQVGGRAKRIPLSLKGGTWNGKELEVDEQTIRVLKTEDIIMRRYDRGTDNVGLAVIFARGSRKVAHPPEQCYEADGFEVEQNRTDTFQTETGQRIQVRRLLITRQGVSQVVFYWYKAGDKNTPSFFWQQFHVIMANLNPFKAKDTRVALIRFNTHLRTREQVPAALDLLREFGRDIFPEIEAKLQ